MTTSALVGLHGAVEPRVGNYPPALAYDRGVDAADLASIAGLDLDEWQRFVLRQACSTVAGEQWSAFEVALMVPRQNGKGAVLEARELAGLFLFGEQLILHSAHEFKTAAEAFRRVLWLVENTDDLRKRVRKVRTSHGEEGIELLTGARLRFVARSTGSGRGFSGDCVILDEAYNLSADNMAALLPTLSARPNPQLWYTSSAGMDTSEQLSRVRERGRRGGDVGLAYFEYSAGPKSSLDDREAWALANPALGIRIPEHFIARERAALPDVEFARERLGIWSDFQGTHVIESSTWESLADKVSTPVGMVGMSVDTSPDRSVSSLAIAGRRADSRLHVEVPENRGGTEWVVPRVVGICARQDIGAVAIDPRSQASGFIGQLREAGVPVLEMSTREATQACGAFFDAATTDQLRHLGDPLLATSLAGATKRDVSDAWLWNRRTARSDITPLVAATNAAWAHERAAAEKPTEVWGFFT